MIENLVLDWAGTLADDIHLTLEATNRSLAELGGEPIDLPTYRADFRIPVMEFYGPRLPGCTHEQVDESFFRHYRKAIPEIMLFPGVETLLRTAQQRGRRLFVLSTLDPPILERMVEVRGLTGVFEKLHGGAIDKREVLPALIAEHGLERDRTLYVGDTDHDVEAAHAAGVRAGASLYGYGTRERIMAARPDDAFESVADLSALLDREHLLDTVPLVIPTVGGVVVGPDGRILLVRTKKWSNTYGIPGGKIDYGETMLAAYEREMREETGLEVTDSRFVMIQDAHEPREFVKKRHFLLINYLSRVESPDALRTNYELEEAIWVTLDQAFGMNLNEPTRAVLDEIVERGWLSGDAS